MRTKSSQDYAVYAEHEEDGSRTLDQVDVLPGAERPFVYVARGSRLLFSPGKHPAASAAIGAEDFANGERRSPEVRLEVISTRHQPDHRWLQWPGHWRGPSCQGTPSPSTPTAQSATAGAPDGMTEQLAPTLAAEAAPTPALAPRSSLTRRRRVATAIDLLVEDRRPHRPRVEKIRGLVVAATRPTTPASRP